jgi:hypothetical protein
MKITRRSFIGLMPAFTDKDKFEKWVQTPSGCIHFYSCLLRRWFEMTGQVPERGDGSKMRELIRIGLGLDKLPHEMLDAIATGAPKRTLTEVLAWVQTWPELRCKQIQGHLSILDSLNLCERIQLARLRILKLLDAAERSKLPGGRTDFKKAEESFFQITGWHFIDGDSDAADHYRQIHRAMRIEEFLDTHPELTENQRRDWRDWYHKYLEGKYAKTVFDYAYNYAAPSGIDVDDLVQRLLRKNKACNPGN